MSFALLAITIFLAVLALGFFSGPPPRPRFAYALKWYLRTLIDRITLGAYDTLPGFAPHHVYPAMHRQSESPHDTKANDRKEQTHTTKAAEEWLETQGEQIKENFAKLRGIISFQPITGQFYLLTPNAENKHPVRLSALRTWLQTTPINPITMTPMTLNETTLDDHQAQHSRDYDDFKQRKNVLPQDPGCLTSNTCC